ncbi:hypothetical protein [Tuwongella immobilis]|uniref:Uncharacterized protein n=1 Tax=Tuwongella immobilis TaxID=692036 RepID=A0A6C2YTQ8_9BACT|nr:hypothetical protein [Tuwongella immobilis]VIP04771.1 unnamed protein product [Tuwongella immobilis]VTS06901.1 unnamed protein product [Tuwongella immobilis]
MSIPVTCPHAGCGKQFKVKDAYAGQKGKCPFCKGPIRVPSLPIDEIPMAEPVDLPPTESPVAPVASVPAVPVPVASAPVVSATVPSAGMPDASAPTTKPRPTTAPKPAAKPTPPPSPAAASPFEFMANLPPAPQDASVEPPTTADEPPTVSNDSPFAFDAAEPSPAPPAKSPAKPVSKATPKPAAKPTPPPKPAAKPTAKPASPAPAEDNPFAWSEPEPVAESPANIPPEPAADAVADAGFPTAEPPFADAIHPVPESSQAAGGDAFAFDSLDGAAPTPVTKSTGKPPSKSPTKPAAKPAAKSATKPSAKPTSAAADIDNPFAWQESGDATEPLAPSADALRESSLAPNGEPIAEPIPEADVFVPPSAPTASASTAPVAEPDDADLPSFSFEEMPVPVSLNSPTARAAAKATPKTAAKPAAKSASKAASRSQTPTASPPVADDANADGEFSWDSAAAAPMSAPTDFASADADAAEPSASEPADPEPDLNSPVFQHARLVVRPKAGFIGFGGNARITHQLFPASGDDSIANVRKEKQPFSVKATLLGMIGLGQSPIVLTVSDEESQELLRMEFLPSVLSQMLSRVSKKFAVDLSVGRSKLGQFRFKGGLLSSTAELLAVDSRGNTLAEVRRLSDSTNGIGLVMLDANEHAWGTIRTEGMSDVADTLKNGKMRVKFSAGGGSEGHVAEVDAAFVGQRRVHLFLLALAILVEATGIGKRETGARSAAPSPRRRR